MNTEKPQLTYRTTVKTMSVRQLIVVLDHFQSSFNFCNFTEKNYLFEFQHLYPQFRKSKPLW